MNFHETEKKTNELLHRMRAATNKLKACFGKKLNMDNYSAAVYEFNQIKKEYQKMAARSHSGDQSVFQLGQLLREAESLINTPSNPYNCV